MSHKIQDFLRVLPAGWPEGPMEHKPSDLTMYVPTGLGIAAPMVMMPWAKETLGFGLMVENAYQGVYRVWSRPWLMAK
jgi:hypothetical protein